MPETASDSRLRWRCRRGMLELDLILQEFLDKGYDLLDAKQKQLLDVMLEYPDQLLFDLLLGNMISSDKDIAQFVTRIRNTLRT
ncbi:MAG: antitoxin CptB [Pseudomonadota bacterium]|nr:antitoxin CptB [Pseudomonadota bacterium]